MAAISRREWFRAAATAGGVVAATEWRAIAEAGQANTPAAPKPGYPSRPAGKIEHLFKAPGLSANGMQCTEEGIWTIENAGSRTDTPGRCKVYLSSYEGKLLRELAPEGTGPSGIGVDADNKTIWIGSTYSREIIRSDARTGETIEKHFTPGAGVIYRMTTDLPCAPVPGAGGPGLPATAPPRPTPSPSDGLPAERAPGIAAAPAVRAP